MPLAAGAAEISDLKLPDKVRVGLIGLVGHTSEAFAVARAHPSVEIVAYEASTDEDRRRANRNRVLSSAKAYDDYRKMLDAEALDAACICDENWRRVETVTACLERKIPTAAEKPMAIDFDGLQRVRETAERTRTPLTMLLPMRFTSPYLAMKQIVDEGTIGEPIQLSGQKSYRLGERADWMKRRESFGGTIPYIGCHLVDLLRFVSGRDMVETAAFHAHVGFPQAGEMENTASISYRLDNGGTADVRLDYLRPEAAPSHGDDRLRIAGADGVVEYQGGRVSLITDQEAPHEIVDMPPARRLFAEFLDSVYNGVDHSITQHDLFRVTEIVLRSRDAADTGRVVRI